MFHIVTEHTGSEAWRWWLVLSTSGPRRDAGLGLRIRASCPLITYIYDAYVLTVLQMATPDPYA
jgi:hypothetical protein